MTTLTAARLRELLHYDPETGLFTSRAKGRHAGKHVGAATSKENPRLRIRVNGKKHYAYRLAWLYIYGEWPTQQIDHINGIRTDDRIANLRDVPGHWNAQNLRHARKGNCTGFLGVNPEAGRNGTLRYRAKIRVASRHVTIGRFDTPEQAHAAYVGAKRRMHEGCTI